MNNRDWVFPTWAEASDAHRRAKRQDLEVGPIRRRIPKGDYVFACTGNPTGGGPVTPQLSTRPMGRNL